MKSLSSQLYEQLIGVMTLLKRIMPIHAALIAAMIGLVLVGAIVFGNEGDPMALVRVGTRYLTGDENGTQGYDGQFVFFIAKDLSPQEVASHLDEPAYRYQRILLPLLAKLVAVGDPGVIPWAIPVINIAAQAMGTWALAQLFLSWGISPAYALVYGAWAGLLLAIRLDLPEPLAYGLVIGALLALSKKRAFLGGLMFGLAIFAKEVVLVFGVAAWLAMLWERRWRAFWALTFLALIPFALFQWWLWQVFGTVGIGAGGAMATRFEVVPFWGLLRIGQYSQVYLLAMLLVFGPAVVFPTIAGGWAAAGRVLRGDIDSINLNMVFTAGVMMALPFSTYRETGGLLRMATGLVLAVLLFMGRNRLSKNMRFTVLWLVLGAFLVKPV